MSVKARFLSVLTLALAACCLAACAFAPAPQSAGESASSAPQSAAESESAGESASAADGESVGAGALSAAEERLAAMTLREKVGQLFLIRPESLCAGLSPDEVHDASGPAATAWDEDMAAMLAEYPASGVVLFGKNIASPEQLSDFVIAMQRAAGTGLFIGVDEEGGSVSRIANTPGFDVPVFESMQAVGETGDAANAREVGAAIGAYLRLYGFNLDFAPVADVNTNPENVVIGARAFGSDPALVARMDAAVLEGLHSEGVLGCLKHFPGHGDTVGDTHDGAVSITKTWDELLGCELVPFVENFENTDLVMAAHISLPNVTQNGLPASLSHEIITGRLRGELGYDGLVVTDSLAMGAIANEYTSAESAVLAVQAGVDLLLMPRDYAAAFEGVLEAVESGKISEARLDESVLRILQAKERCGLL